MSIRIGIGVEIWNARRRLSPEALAWQTNIISNGGTIPAATLAIFDEVFFKPAKANGNILNQLDRLNIYCGLLGFEIAARTNIIKAAHYVTPVSSPTFDNNGYKSSGTSYLDLNYNAFSNGVLYTLNSAIYGYVVKNPAYTTQIRPIGCGNLASSQRMDLQRNSAGNDGFINSNNATSDTNKPTGNVFIAMQRTAINSTKLIVNTNFTNNSHVSTAIPNFNNYELCLNFANTALGPFDIFSHLSSFHGSSSCDFNNLRLILNNLFIALGV